MEDDGNATGQMTQLNGQVQKYMKFSLHNKPTDHITTTSTWEWNTVHPAMIACMNINQFLLLFNRGPIEIIYYL